MAIHKKRKYHNLNVIELTGRSRYRLAHCPKYKKYDSQYMFCGPKRIVIVQCNQRNGGAKAFTAKILHHSQDRVRQTIEHFDTLYEAGAWAEKRAMGMMKDVDK
jgi:hypothetical protein